MAVYDINRILVPDAPPEYEDHTRDVHYVPAPCQVACPIGTDAPSYIAHIWDEDYEGAFEAITSTNPFSSICGRVCDAPCEPACRRVDSDGAVQIRNLKRFVMDKLGATWRPSAAPVTRSRSIGIVGAGPAGLVAAHDLCVAGYSVHVYEMTDRLGGMMIWGIPAFRLPPGIIDEDVERLMQRCPGLEVHLDTALGRDVSLDELKERHDAVLLTIGAWWGKPMGIPGEEDERVVDGVGFLRRVNAGERPEMPETVVVVGGGDVAMDACRVAKRLPGCKQVKVIYRRGPGEIPARKIELHHAIKEDVEFLYHTQQVAVVPRGNQLALKCVKTALGEPDDDGRRRPVAIEGSEHEILCGSVSRRGRAARHLRGAPPGRHDGAGPGPHRVGFDAYLGSNGIRGRRRRVRRLHHRDGDAARAARRLLRAALSRGQPGPAALSHALPHPAACRSLKTSCGRSFPSRTRCSADWASDRPSFPRSSSPTTRIPPGRRRHAATAAMRRPAPPITRCSTARTSSRWPAPIRRMRRSSRRCSTGACACARTPFPEERPACLDDLVFLPANLSRLVIDPYREACKISWRLGERLDLDIPFFVAGFDAASEEAEGADRPWRRCRGRRLPGGDPPRSERPVVAALRAGTRRPESRRGRGGVPGRRALAPDADRPRACRAAPRPSPRLTP